MTNAISSLSLADITANTTRLVASVSGTGTQASLTLAAKETLRKIDLLKDLLGNDAKDFRLLLEIHAPENAFVRPGDECPNAWNIVGLQAHNPRLPALETLLRKTGITPSTVDNTTVSYSGDELKAMLVTLEELQSRKR